MNRSLITALLIVAALLVGRSQELTLTYAPDTLLLGNTATVTYRADNIDCALDINLSELPIISGPSRSSSTSIINGTIRRSEALTISIQPQTVGPLVLPSISCIMGKDTLQAWGSIIVLDNPEGIQQGQPPAISPSDRSRSSAPRVRRKLRKI